MLIFLITYFRNLLFSPRQSNIFGSSAFAGIYDSYQIYEKSDSKGRDKSKLWSEVERQTSLVILAVQSAQKILLSDILS